MRKHSAHQNPNEFLRMRVFQQQLDAGLPRGEALRILLMQVIAALDADRGALYLSDGDTMTVFPGGDDSDFSKPALKKELEQAGEDPPPLLINTARTLAAPLWSYGRIAGVLGVKNKQGETNFVDFSKADQRFLSAAAATVSITLERMSLFNRLQALNSQEIPTGLIGQAEAIRQVNALIERYAGQDIVAPVLIQGETGTGKELVAGALHARSSRAGKPFISVNCGALPVNLLESELFGHTKGAFTGAVHSRKGHFEAANEGVIFLDEIGEMSPELQVKLLRVLESNTFRPLGGSEEKRSDFWLICATNRDLEQAVREKTFREDLYYRLRYLRIMMPALREHPEDIQLLIKYFLNSLNMQSNRKQISGVTPRALYLLRQHKWPGNVRELRSVIGSAFFLSDGPLIDVDHLPPEIREQHQPASLVIDSIEPLDDVIARYVKFAYEKEDRHTTRTMDKLKIEHRRLKRYLRRAMAANLSIELQPRENVELEALKAVAPIMRDAGLSKEQRMAVRRALIEAIINAVEHSKTREEKIEVHIKVTPRQFRMTVHDHGPGFDFEKLPRVDIHKKKRNKEVRGWGYHLIRNSMDFLDVQSDTSGTIVTMGINR